jgi:hypothetical protein
MIVIAGIFWLHAKRARTLKRTEIPPVLTKPRGETWGKIEQPENKDPRDETDPAPSAPVVAKSKLRLTQRLAREIRRTRSRSPDPQSMLRETRRPGSRRLIARELAISPAEAALIRKWLRPRGV